MIFDRLENGLNYSSSIVWRTAFAFLSSAGPDTPEGDPVFESPDLKAIVVRTATLSPEEAVLESHRHDIDLHVVLDGAERIEWFPRAGLAVKIPYDRRLDAEVYSRPGSGPAVLTLQPGFFVAFFPADAHMPKLNIGGAPSTAKKAVIKIKAAKWR